MRKQIHYRRDRRLRTRQTFQSSRQYIVRSLRMPIVIAKMPCMKTKRHISTPIIYTYRYNLDARQESGRSAAAKKNRIFIDSDHLRQAVSEVDRRGVGLYR